jgi:glycerate kinase
MRERIDAHPGARIAYRGVMKIILAFDSFKGTMSAREACAEAAEAIRTVRPDSELILKPMADGGEGTAEAVLAARPGEWVPVPVTGPLLSMTVDAGFAWFPEDGTALVEMAAASGITLLRRDQLNPLRTTTLGTGELIRAAIEHGARRILLAAGGSATVDGGIGVARAMGWSFRDADSRELPPVGGSLQKITEVLPPPVSSSPLPPLLVLADVDNPLCGPRGAAPVFGPQKGATPAMVEQLDAGLLNLAAKLAACGHGPDLLALRGGGAAGGLAAGAVGFLGGEIVSGIETIMEVSGLGDELQGADWVVTGEGKFDDQSLHGKVVSGISGLARRHRVKVAVIAGSVQVPPAEWKSAGIQCALPTAPPDMPLDQALSRARELLAQAARHFAMEHAV